MVTIRERVAVAGFEPDTFTSAPTSGTTKPFTKDNNGAPAIMGLMYATNFRSEEEWGVKSLRDALVGDARRFQIQPGREKHIRLFEDVNAFAISEDPFPDTADGSMKWGDELHQRYDTSTPPPYAERWYGRLDYAQRVATRYDLAKRPMGELRAVATAAGLESLPRKKVDLIELLSNNDVDVREEPHQWPGWFYYGQTLVVRADNGAAAEVVSGLRDALVAGTLGLAPSSSAFGHGLFLYDTADESESLKKQRDERWAWEDQQLREAAQLRKSLLERWNVTTFTAPQMRGEQVTFRVSLTRRTSAARPSLAAGDRVTGRYSVAQLTHLAG